MENSNLAVNRPLAPLQWAIKIDYRITWNRTQGKFVLKCATLNKHASWIYMHKNAQTKVHPAASQQYSKTVPLWHVHWWQIAQSPPVNTMCAYTPYNLDSTVFFQSLTEWLLHLTKNIDKRKLLCGNCSMQLNMLTTVRLHYLHNSMENCYSVIFNTICTCKRLCPLMWTSKGVWGTPHCL